MRLKSALTHIALAGLLILAGHVFVAPIGVSAAEGSAQEESASQTVDAGAEPRSELLTEPDPIGPGQVISTALMGMLQLFVVTVFLLQCGLFTWWLAGQKGYNKRTWLALGFFFSLLALLAMVGAPVRERQDEDEDEDEQG